MAFALEQLDFPKVAWLIFVSGALYITVGVIANYRMLRQFKGPTLAAFSRVWLFWKVISKQQRDAQVAAHKTYGPVVRIGPDLLLTDDPDIIRHMNLPGSQWRRSGWYDAMRFDPRSDSVFSTRDEKLHAELRQAELGGYNGKAIDTLEPSVDARVVEFVALINKKYSGRAVDMSSLARYFTLDVLSTVAFGSPFGFMEADEDLWEYNQTNEAFVSIVTLSANHFLVRWLLFTPAVQWLVGPRVTDQKGLGPALAFARRAVAERYGENPKKRRDMLGYFVDKGLSQTQCEVEAFLQIIAGSDSTTTVVRSTMFLLVSNPTVYSKLRTEIDRAVAEGTATDPVITYAEAQRLPYLVACIWEGLRMYPPLFGLKSKIAPPGGEQIKDYFFPEGTELGSCDYAFTRSKEIFGDDADLFRPDRWILASQEEKVKYRYTVDTIFGSGKYLCLGRHIAFIELHKVFFELVRAFDWSIADPMEGIKSYATSVLFQRDMNMVAWPRT